MGTDFNINESSEPYVGGKWTGIILSAVVQALAGGVADADALGSAALTQANAAQSMSPRPRAAGALQTADGQTFTGTSAKGGLPTLHPEVQQVMDSIPLNMRSASHGCCVEPQVISNALNGGSNPTGGVMDILRVRAPGNPNHATSLPPCSSCGILLRRFEITPKQ